MNKYDLVVIGAGPAGYVAAIKAAQLGAKTAIIEKDFFGGTCLNIGCIPTKTLIHDAELVRNIRNAGQRGIKVNKPEVDIKKIMQNKNEVVKKLSQGIHGLLISNGVEIFEGLGVVKENNIIEISLKNADEDLKSIEYEKLIIASGSKPIIPKIKGIEENGIYSSSDLINTDEIPEHLLIIGGGAIGCEFATIYKAFGSKVTIVEAMPRLLVNFEKTLSLLMTKSLKAQGIEVRTKSKVESIKRTGNYYEVIVESLGETEKIPVDRVLYSIGREPNLKGFEILKLEQENGFIKVDETYKTSVDNVYAGGDVTGFKMLAHVAFAMGKTIAENVMGANNKLDLTNVPSCIYTIPEISTVGLTEKAAKEKFGEIVVGKFPMSASGKAKTMNVEDGVIKLIADKKTDRVVGAHIIGPNATEIIGEVVAYMKMEATLEEIMNTIHAHPTISEGIMEAALDAKGQSIHLLKR